jgi:hypothetical protein
MITLIEETHASRTMTASRAAIFTLASRFVTSRYACLIAEYDYAITPDTLRQGMSHKYTASFIHALLPPDLLIMSSRYAFSSNTSFEHRLRIDSTRFL